MNSSSGRPAVRCGRTRPARRTTLVVQAVLGDSPPARTSRQRLPHHRTDRLIAANNTVRSFRIPRIRLPVVTHVAQPFIQCASARITLLDAQLRSVQPSVENALLSRLNQESADAAGLQGRVYSQLPQSSRARIHLVVNSADRHGHVGRRAHGQVVHHPGPSALQLSGDLRQMQSRTRPRAPLQIFLTQITHRQIHDNLGHPPHLLLISVTTIASAGNGISPRRRRRRWSG